MLEGAPDTEMQVLGSEIGDVRWQGVRRYGWRRDRRFALDNNKIFLIDFLFGTNFLVTEKLQRCWVSVYALANFP